MNPMVDDLAAVKSRLLLSGGVMDNNFAGEVSGGVGGLQRAVSAPEASWGGRAAGGWPPPVGSGGASLETYRGLMQRNIPVIQLTQDEPDPAPDPQLD